MAAPTIQIDVATVGLGSPSASRTDGVLAQVCTLTDPANGAGAYTWDLFARPVGSAAVLTGAATATATFTPDVTGTYLVKLTFNGGGGDELSGADNVISEFQTTQGGLSVLLANGQQIPAAGETTQFHAEGWHRAMDPLIRNVDAYLPSAAEKTDLGVLQGGAEGSIFYSDATGAITELGFGTSGEVLTTQGVGNPPAWAAVASGGTTLQSSYDGGAAIITAALGPVAMSRVLTDATTTLSVSKIPAAPAAGSAFVVTAGANLTGPAMSIVNGGTGGALTWDAGQMLAQDGTNVLPAYSFTGATGMGMTRTTGRLEFNTNGVRRMYMTDTQVVISSAGNAAAPGLTLGNTTANGFFYSAGEVGLATSGTEATRWNAAQQTLASDGIVTAPGYVFQGSVNTGFWYNGSLNISAGGGIQMAINVTENINYNPVSLVELAIGSVPASNNGRGMLWVVNDVAQTLYFRDDAGVDFAVGGALATSGGDLDTAYDFGGAGVGRAIIVDTGAVTLTTDAVGVAETTAFEIINSTVAAAGVQQFSPMAVFQGSGWKTDVTAASQTVAFAQQVETIQGAAAPTGELVFKASINVAGYGDVAKLTSGGQWLMPSGGASLPSYSFATYPTTGLWADGALRFSVSALTKATLNATYFAIHHSTSSSVPRFIQGGSTTTGVGFPAAGETSIITGGTEAMRWNASQQSLFADGVVGAPGLALASDEDTGLYGTAGFLNFVAGGLLAFRISTSQVQLYKDTAPGSDFLYDLGASTRRFDNTYLGRTVITPKAYATGALVDLTYTAPAHTNLTLSTEVPSVLFDISASKQWATGALAAQRFVKFMQPTVAFVAASTAAIASTVYIEGEPLEGTFATITAPAALEIGSGQILGPNGTAALPTYSFGPDNDSGLYATSGSVDLSNNGTNRMSLTSSQCKLGIVVSPTVPKLALSTDTNTGVGWFAADEMGIITNATEATRWNASQQMVVSAGSTALPPITTAADVTSGFRIASGNVYISLGGLQKMRWANTGTCSSSLNIVSISDYTYDLGTSASRWGQVYAGDLFVEPEANTSGVQEDLKYTAPAHTNLTVATEVPSVLFDISATKSWSIGALAEQSAFKILGPTYDVGAATAITNASTLFIDAAPLPGGTSTITEPWVISAARDTDSRFAFGKAVFHSATTDRMMLSHYDQRDSTTAYAVAQTAAGVTILNTASTISLATTGTLRFQVASTYLQASNANGPHIKNAAPTATNPSLVPNRSDITSGIGHGTGGGEVSIITGATEATRWNASQQQLAIDGSKTLPAYSFASNQDAGLALSATDIQITFNDTLSCLFNATNTTIYTTLRPNADYAQTIGNASRRFSQIYAGRLSVEPQAQSSGVLNDILYTAPVHTNLTLSTEVPSVLFDMSAIKTWATGALATQRFFKIDAPTINFTAASNVTGDTATVYIGGAPAMGINATLTGAAWALWVDAGATRLDGALTVAGAVEIDGDLNHDGSTVGFYGNAPVTRPAAYTTSGGDDRVFSSSNMTTSEMTLVLGTLIRDLQSVGLLQGT